MGLDNRTKEFVAVGVALGANCVPCMQWHYKKCLEFGATNSDMQEIMDLAKKIVQNKKNFDNMKS
ncbi:MAG: carboxymuconolactone decarboxylase family protein [Bacillota bacterium]